MRSNTPRSLQPLLAAVVLALIVAPIAMANGAGASAAPSKGTLKQIKKLKKQTALLMERVAALEGKAAAPVPPAAPAGPAGGDLTGSYPNPELRTGSVLSPEIANGSIRAVDIGADAVVGPQVVDGSLTGADLAFASVGKTSLAGEVIGANQLAATTVSMDALILAGGQEGEIFVSCPAGTQMISGGAEWETREPTLLITGSAPASGGAWKVQGRNGTNSTRTLLAKALCLIE